MDVDGDKTSQELTLPVNTTLRTSHALGTRIQSHPRRVCERKQGSLLDQPQLPLLEEVPFLHNRKDQPKGGFLQGSAGSSVLLAALLQKVDFPHFLRGPQVLRSTDVGKPARYTVRVAGIRRAREPCQRPLLAGPEMSTRQGPSLTLLVGMTGSISRPTEPCYLTSQHQHRNTP